MLDIDIASLRVCGVCTTASQKPCGSASVSIRVLKSLCLLMDKIDLELTGLLFQVPPINSVSLSGPAQVLFP